MRWPLRRRGHAGQRDKVKDLKRDWLKEEQKSTEYDVDPNQEYFNDGGEAGAAEKE